MMPKIIAGDVLPAEWCELQEVAAESRDLDFTQRSVLMSKLAATRAWFSGRWVYDRAALEAELEPLKAEAAAKAMKDELDTGRLKSISGHFTQLKATGGI